MNYRNACESVSLRATHLVLRAIRFSRGPFSTTKGAFLDPSVQVGRNDTAYGAAHSKPSLIPVLNEWIVQSTYYEKSVETCLAYNTSAIEPLAGITEKIYRTQSSIVKYPSHA
ncbi:uncharacterized protein BDR25DRAFT_351864 [Lindgomyces ingoldianus]|uniref:Uncharacterized protein n=1 Tax=Lindgomyces ingoldianus TaxID=673940 RepID=A0ACB6R709_9PLEO|nr:uncharacterized protein BDR25DRAFT_351864 [Lindgomyces ingoldianus]KAF2474312.1 hypothetical protein BDR25DRAFT_351864 [Lindgomyces ingoldianus]